MRNYFFEPLNFQFSVFNFQFSILFGRSGSAYSSAVGLSAISLLASFPPRSKMSVVCCPKMLAKDAAPIPNAKALYKLKCC